MSKYVKSFTPFYEGGWENQPSENTPIMGEALDAYDSTFVKIEEYLESYEPDIPQVEIPTKVSELENDAGYLTEETVKDVEFSSLVPTSRTIVGIDLADDITEEELKSALGVDYIIEDIEEMQSNITDLQNVRDITETTNTILANSYAGRLKVNEIVGGMEQESTTGKNKFHCNFSAAQTQYGVTLSPVFAAEGNAEGYPTGALLYLVANGTATDNPVFDIGTYNYVANEKVVLSGCPTGGSWSTYMLYSQYAEIHDTGNEIEYTPSSNLTDNIKIIFYQGTTLNNVKFYPMISADGGTYEPYGVGVSPSTTNQQEIKNSVVSGIKTHGKNFLYCKGLSESTSSGVTIAPKYDSNGLLEYIILNGTATEIVDKKLGAFNYDAGTKYVASNGASGSSSTFALYSSVIGTIYSTKTFEATEDGTSDVSLSIFKGAILSNVKLYPQLEVGTVATEYEPYTESVVTFSQPIELYGEDDVRDILTSKQIKRKYAYKRILGSNIVKVNANAEYGNSIYTDLFGKPKGKCLCTHFLSVAYEDRTKYLGLYRCYIDEVGLDLRLRSSVNDPNTFSDLETTKSFFDTNEVYAVYELSEETTEELPLVDQIALNSLQTFDGITYLEFIYDELEPTFKAKYGTTEMGGMTLESLLTARNNDLRLSAVESAVINNI